MPKKIVKYNKKRFRNTGVSPVVLSPKKPDCKLIAQLSVGEDQFSKYYMRLSALLQLLIEFQIFF